MKRFLFSILSVGFFLGACTATVVSVYGSSLGIPVREVFISSYSYGGLVALAVVFILIATLSAAQIGSGRRRIKVPFINKR